MTTVAQVLDVKGHETWSVSPNDTVLDALKLMTTKNIGAVLVMDQGQMVGILSERDCARNMAASGVCSLNSPVREIMTEKVVCVHADQDLEEVMAVMTARRVRHLPVCQNDKLAGLISIGDVVKSLISDREFLIDQLETYIVSG
jgi:CBS domain-containing protein